MLAPLLYLDPPPQRPGDMGVAGIEGTPTELPEEETEVDAKNRKSVDPDSQLAEAAADSGAAQRARTQRGRERIVTPGQ